MKLLLLAGILSLFIGGPAIARADDCTGKLTEQQSQTYASLTPANQQILVKMKMKDGSAATCEFRAGLLDMLGHYPPPDRDAGFQDLLKHTFVKQH
jgi:hypothetical protein